MTADRSEPAGPGETPAAAPTPGQTLGAMWLYTVLRFGQFLALWALLWVARVPGLLAATIALVLSIPLSYILLRKQRDRLAANLEARVTARQSQRHDLATQLAGGSEDEVSHAEPLATEAPAAKPGTGEPEPGSGRSARL